MAVDIPPLIKPSRLRRRGGLLGECLAEFLGTFVLISFGCGVVATAVAALPGSGRTAGPTTIFLAAGDWLLITWGWAMAVVFGIYVAGGVSGAHINPAVTLASALRRGFPWSKVPSYWAAQVAGGFAGGALVYWVYHNAINSYEHVNHITKGAKTSLPTYSIFSTFPAGYFPNWSGAFLDEVVGTAFLVCFVFAIIDEFNQAVKANLAPFIVGIAVVAIGTSFGANSGYAINPARDFGPRLLAWAAGYGKLAMPGDYGNVNTYFWIPIVGPLLGAAIGAIVYDLFIRDVLQARRVPPDVSVEPSGRTAREVPPQEEF
jgi:glycerol uptake facilitator protein